MNLYDSIFRVCRLRFANGCKCDYSTEPRPFFVFSYIENGSVELWEGDIHLCLNPGDILFIPEGSRYLSHWHSDDFSVCYSLFFNLPAYTEPILNKSYPLQKISGCEHLAPVFKALADKELCVNAPLQAMSSFYSVCHELFSKLKYTKTAPIDETILMAVEYINKNYNRRISVSELALMCNMSQSRFFTTFKAATGKTPIDYKNSVLVSRASQLLVSQSTRSIEQISDFLGFESSSYFRRLFKSLTGKTPREYRKNIINGM